MCVCVCVCCLSWSLLRCKQSLFPVSSLYMSPTHVLLYHCLCLKSTVTAAVFRWPLHRSPLLPECLCFLAPFTLLWSGTAISHHHRKNCACNILRVKTASLQYLYGSIQLKIAVSLLLCLIYRLKFIINIHVEKNSMHKAWCYCTGVSSCTSHG